MGLDVDQVYHGDCVELVGKLAPGSIDLAFADPPFNIGYEYDEYDDRRQADEYVAWCTQWLRGLFEALKPDGTFWLAIGDEFAAELKLAAQQIGFFPRSWVIWYYTFGVNCRRGFSRSHTHLFHFVKDRQRFAFNQDNPAVRVPSARQLVYGDGRAHARGRLPDNTWILRPQDLRGGMPADHDTWYFPRVAGTFHERQGFHGCQMPEQLLGRIIRLTSHPHDVVLDPFAGSGTTLAVAKKLGRRWIGFELSQQYTAYVRQRLDAIAPGQPLDGPADPLASAPPTRHGRRLAATGSSLRKNGSAKAHGPARLEWETTIKSALAELGHHSIDRVLADPELNREFAARCKSAQLPGDPTTWNQMLLRLRKSGRIAKSESAERFRIPWSRLDPLSAASEIALQLMQVDSGLTIDELLCNPAMAARFDEWAARFASGFSPLEYRWAALGLRKRAGAARASADRTSSPMEPLPEPVALQRALRTTEHEPAVYLVLGTRGRPLYVGETIDLRRRVEQLASVPGWLELDPKAVRVWPTPSRELAARRVVIARHFAPPLNWLAGYVAESATALA